MTYVVAFIGVVALVGLYLWMRVRTELNEVAYKAEVDQRIAESKLRIDTEMSRRAEEAQEIVKNAQEAINRRNAAADKLRD